MQTASPVRLFQFWKSALFFLFASFVPFVPPRTRGSHGPSVLSLDGGGCRGYLTLLILKQQLRQIQPEGLIYPYLYFDLICGTSTGGLIAILLGVLHLDIDTAIEIYVRMTKEVFFKRFSFIRWWEKGAGYSSEPLKVAIEEILEKYGEGRTLMVDPERDKGCRVFVTAAQCDGDKPDVRLLRSYPNPDKRDPKDYDHPWAIKDVALATTAAPFFFDRHAVIMNGTKVLFEDPGANGANNPTMLARKECQRLSDLQGENSLFISLGTGSAPSPPKSSICGIFQNLKQVKAFKKLLTHAMDVRRVHEEMEEHAKNSQMSYHRINPPLNERITLGDWKKLPAMKLIAAGYYETHEGEFHKITECLKKLSKATRGPSAGDSCS